MTDLFTTTSDIGATYETHMGDDLLVVNAARVSFSKRSEWEYGLHNGDKVPFLKPGDQKLIGFLARGMMTDEFDDFVRLIADEGEALSISLEADDAAAIAAHKGKVIEMLYEWRRTPEHWAPFGHPHIHLHVKAPLFVARQMFKHKVGFVESEVSRRYVDEAPEFYMPIEFRKRAENKKQGSSDEVLTGVNARIARDILIESYKEAARAYQGQLREGVCPEQARMALPTGLMTEWKLTGSLWGFARMCRQRLDAHAQYETRVLATSIQSIIKPLFPVSWKELVG